jgi:hypothetical protein
LSVAGTELPQPDRLRVTSTIVAATSASLRERSINADVATL